MARNIVIAAAGRKLGKTLLSSSLVRVLCERGLQVAYFKLRKNLESGVRYLPGPGRENSDTWRMHSAGASETGLFDYGQSFEINEFLSDTALHCDVIIWETNSAAGKIPDAVIVYIDGDIPDPKNPELADAAVIHLSGPLRDISAETSGLILSTAGISGFNPVKPGWKLWLELDSRPVFGGGMVALLESVRDSGSLLAAAKATGIQYRRVWTLISGTEEKLGVRLIYRSRGGSGGGGSRLTPVAEMLLERFHTLEDAMTRAASNIEENNG